MRTAGRSGYRDAVVDASPTGTTDDGRPAGAAGDPAVGNGAGYRTDEERVLDRLRERGGRVRQAEVVEATDWSKAKVSRPLSSMADEGRVRKVTVGRGNVIELPDDGDDGAAGFRQDRPPTED